MSHPLADAIAKHGLTVEAIFIPWSRSREKDRKDPCLNWRIALKKGDREILSTDFTAGQASCPADKRKDPYKKRELIRWECEHGYEARYWESSGVISSQRAPIKPDTSDIVHCLVLDADVLNYATFEEWAENFGYDTDSRKAESIYRTCLETAIKLRARLGEDVLTELQTASQEY
jgi:hypothetical protein